MAVDLEVLLAEFVGRLDGSAPTIRTDEIRPDHETPRDERRLWWPGIVVAIGIAVAIRAPMVGTPITSDEGGFLAIARAWRHGATLYDDVWVDRPQGLLVLFRLWDWLGGSVASVRIMAMLFAAVLIVAVASIATLMAGRWAGNIAALLCAVSASSPAIEGHLANGELLSGAVAVAGLAIGLRGIVTRADPRLFFACGLLCGVALSLKQSGYEGLVVVVGWLGVAAASGWRSPGESMRSAALVMAGTSVVIGALAIHGSLLGFDRWWFAVAGYRFDGRSAADGANWERLAYTASIARPILGPVVLLAALSAVAALVCRRRPGIRFATGHQAVLAIWAVAATAAFLTGGQFHRHYWVTLCPMVSVVAAVAVARAARPPVALALAAIALVPALSSAIGIARLERAEAALAASGDSRSIIDERLSEWLRRNADPGDSVYVMCASAALYANAGADPPYPYLWYDNVTTVPGAQAALRLFLADARRSPRFVAVYQNPIGCDPSGAAARTLASEYRQITAIGGVRVLERIERDGPS